MPAEHWEKKEAPSHSKKLVRGAEFLTAFDKIDALIRYPHTLIHFDPLFDRFTIAYVSSQKNEHKNKVGYFLNMNTVNGEEVRLKKLTEEISTYGIAFQQNENETCAISVPLSWDSTFKNDGRGDIARTQVYPDTIFSVTLPMAALKELEKPLLEKKMAYVLGCASSALSVTPHIEEELAGLGAEVIHNFTPEARKVILTDVERGDMALFDPKKRSWLVDAVQTSDQWRAFRNLSNWRKGEHAHIQIAQEIQKSKCISQIVRLFN